MVDVLTLRRYIGSVVIRELAAHHITRAMEEVENDDLPFDELFGGAKRVVVPFIPPELKKLETLLGDYGEVNLEDGTFSQTKETRRGPQTRTMRLGKALTRIHREMKKKATELAKQLAKKWGGKVWIAEQNRFTHSTQDRIRSIASEELLYDILTGTHATYKVAKPGSKYYFIQRAGPKGSHEPIERDDPRYIKNDPLYQKWYAADELKVDLEEAIETWNKQGGGYSIVVSRAPIDVLRMSDFRHIQSCHSQGGSYFRCAVEEAAEGGGIAYLVKTSDLDKVDLDANEIFQDRERGVEGIEPLARVRLRRFDHKDEGYSLAVPESRVYGTDREGFLETVVRWAHDQQIDQFTDEDGNVELPDMHEFEMIGGSYSDTPSGDLWNEMFDVDHYSGDVGAQNIADQYAEEAREYERMHEGKAKHAYWNFDEDMEEYDGNVYFRFSGGIQFEVPSFNKKWDWKDERELGKVLSNAVSSWMPSIANIYYDDYGQQHSLYVDLEPSEIGHPDDYDSFIRELIEVEEKYYHEMEMALHKFLWSKGYISSATGIQRYEDIEEFEHFDLERGTTWETSILQIPLGPAKLNVTSEVKKAFIESMKQDLAKIATPEPTKQLALPHVEIGSPTPMSAKNINVDVYSSGPTENVFKWDLGFTFRPQDLNASLNFIEYLDENFDEVEELAAKVLRKVVYGR